jgi:adenylosuccinate synthase
VRSYDDLPANAKSYISAIEQSIGVRIACVSVGPERTQILFPGDAEEW